jgi:hypothetical protein
MAKSPQVLEHLGPYCQHSPIAACCDLTEQVWTTYRELTGSNEHVGLDAHQYLITRMLYIAEVTSTAVRLNASWALTHAAMSLLRDRYEQAVRFSWLVRNPDKEEFAKYERAMVAKINTLVRNLNPATREHYEEIIGAIPAWATDPLTKDERAFLGAWGALDLRTMATKRDAFPTLADTVIARESLGHWYESIYAQFSSVSHYDRYSIELLGLHKAPDGKFVLAAQPHWPALLILQNAYFDIVQCFEAAHVYHHADAAVRFEALLATWIITSKNMRLG